MSIFRRKQHQDINNAEPPKPADVKPAEQTPAVQEDDGGELAAVIIAAICAGGQALPSNLVVRSIIRIPEQGTAWNRLQLSESNL